MALIWKLNIILDARFGKFLELFRIFVQIWKGDDFFLKWKMIIVAVHRLTLTFEKNIGNKQGS